MSIEIVLYRAQATATGGRDGRAVSSDGALDVQLSVPHELGGAGGPGTNPEQLFAAGWSACFIGAMHIAAGKANVKLPAETAVDAEVDLCNVDGAYFLQARLHVSLPGIARDTARAIVDAAHQTCPYSKATRGNIDVVLSIA